VLFLLEDYLTQFIPKYTSVCHTISPRVEFGVWFWPRSWNWTPGLPFLRPESELET